MIKPLYTRDSMSEKKIVYIDIDCLGIDKCNIRQGIWEHDEELVNSIKERGIRVPLLVRPTSPTEQKKYAIVCGSRRYNAAVEAGVHEVPCVIEDMTDIEAMTESMIENRQRKGTPTWMDIKYIGYVYYQYLKMGMSPDDAVKEIYGKTGIGETTIKRYVRIYDLPIEVKGLLREPEERTSRQKECLKLFEARKTNRTLTFGKADSLAELKGFPLQKLMEGAVFILNKSDYTAEKLIDFVKMYPDRPVKELYDEFVEKEFGTYEKVLRFDRDTWEAISCACMDRQKHYADLCIKIIKEWLKKNRYWKTEKLIFTTPTLGQTISKVKSFEEEIEQPEKNLYVKVRTRKRKLERYGYHFVKKQGDTLIYQKPVKDGSGGFYKAFRKGNTIYLRLTPANYADPKYLLNAEKESLES